MQKTYKDKLKQLLQLLITIALFVFIFKKIEFNSLISLIGQINPKYLLLIWLLSLSFVAFPAYRTFLGVKFVAKGKLTWGESYQYFLVGMFYNNILPSSIGGDVARIYLLYKKTAEIYKVSSVIIFERLVGAVATIVISLVASIFIFQLEGLVALLYYIIIAGSVLGVTLFILLNPKLVKVVSKFGRVKQFLEAIQAFKSSYSLIVKIFIFSILYQLADITIAFLLARLLDIDIAYIYFLVFIPLVYIITLIPLTINGLGLRENLLVYLLGLLGVAGPNALLLALLIYMDRVTRGLVGGLILLRYNLLGEGKEDKT